MKNLVIIVLALATLGLGAALWQQRGKTAQQEAKLTALQQQADDAQAALAQQESQVTRLHEQLAAAQQESAANAGAAAKLSLALTNQVAARAVAPEETTNSKPANPLAEMFKNPEMRDMIKQQQKTVLGGMVDKNYAEFFKSMNLTPEQTAAMKDLILNKMLGGADVGMEMMGGELDADQRAELLQRVKESSDAVNQQIKDLLGADNYALFETYEKSIPDRMAISQFKDQLATDMALNANQESLLIAALGEERQNFKFTTDFSNQNDFSSDIFSKFTEENLNVFFQEQEQLNQKYLARAQTILSSAQYDAYARALKNQQDMAKMGMQMALQMFGKKK